MREQSSISEVCSKSAAAQVYLNESTDGRLQGNQLKDAVLQNIFTKN